MKSYLVVFFINLKTVVYLKTVVDFNTNETKPTRIDSKSVFLAFLLKSYLKGEVIVVS